MNVLRNRAPVLVTLLLAIFAAACASGDSSSSPPGAKFSNASLAGQYAFSMSGSELCRGQPSFFTRTGTFAADGHGNVTGGLEDINVCTGTATIPFTGGRYTIGATGGGTLSLTNSTGTTHYSITLVSATQGVIAQTDTDSTAGGSFERQNRAAFSNPAIAGGYVFDFNGVEVGAAVNPASIVGRFDADGAGGVTRGVFDSNIAGSLSGQQPFPAGAFYQLDTNGDGSAWGRGTARIAGRVFAFYVVDATRVKFIGTDFPSALIGDAVAQENVLFTTASLGGSFAFSIGGTSPRGVIATAGRFTADGGGTITNVVIDENDSGFITLLPSGTVTGSYTVDSNHLGGGTLTWTDTNIQGTFSFIFYLISPTQAVFQETDTTIVSDGAFSAQTASRISPAALAGDYAFAWSGISSRGPEDFVGQLTLAASGSVSGKMDFNEFGIGTLFFNVPISGNLTLSGDGTQANTFTVNLQTSPAATIHFTVYVVDQNTLLPVGDVVNQDRVIAGALIRQP